MRDFAVRVEQFNSELLQWSCSNICDSNSRGFIRICEQNTL